MNVLIVAGTRPEIIKLAPVKLALDAVPGYQVKVCLTGQHRELSEQMMSVFRLVADYDLKVMHSGQNPRLILSILIDQLSKVIDEVAPRLVVVQGDTTSTLAAAICSAYSRVPVAHVEAGLRTGNPDHPFPEEFNRRMVSAVTALHFCPTASAERNLLDEGVDPSRTHLVGNTVIDALRIAVEELKRPIPLPADLAQVLANQAVARRFILATLHRRESFGPALQQVFKGLRKASEDLGIPVILPLHPNPNVQTAARTALKGATTVHIIEPLDYLSFVHVMSRSYLIVTDSGGIQEEAPFFGIPVVVARETTERTESLEAGASILVGTNPDKLVDAIKSIALNANVYRKMAQKRAIYGDGHSAEAIARVFTQFLGLNV